jgi:hypothetical protein
MTEWETFTVQRDKFEAAMNSAIEAAGAIALNTDSPLSSLARQRYANALPKLIWWRDEVLHR